MNPTFSRDSCSLPLPRTSRRRCERSRLEDKPTKRSTRAISARGRAQRAAKYKREKEEDEEAEGRGKVETRGTSEGREGEEK